ncbi:ATP-dependent protease LonB [Nanoarchaeota archaeon]
MGGLNFKSTAEIKIPSKLVDQVIGQDEGVEIIKKAAKQKRHVLLIGEPGTGKSMLGMALAELIPVKGELEDVLCYPNKKDANNPLIKAYPAGEGEKTIVRLRKTFETSVASRRLLLLIIGGGFLLVAGYFLWNFFKNIEYGPLVVFSGLGNLIWIVVLVGLLMSRAPGIFKSLSGLAMLPKPIITYKKGDQAPFTDATGAHAGALLGDVLHDPFQSGGLGTPPHERVMPGMIHKSNQGVLFVDEVATLEPRSQQELLTALQEGKYPITGQSERSAGAMVRTEPVPCRFVMVAAGNVETIQKMHPALRSRIRGYGYEVHMNETMLDTPSNREKIARFVAQEVHKDKKIPHFSKDAVLSIIEEAQRRANRKGHLTLHLRSLGGLIRAAGDLAREQKNKVVERDHIRGAKKLARPLEQQMADKFIERKKEYEVIITQGQRVGRVNGLAVIGSGTAYSGIILPIEAEVTTGGKERRFIATGKLGQIAKEAIKNVSAIVMKHFGEDIKEKYDVYVQFLQTYEGVEGDSASIAVAAAIISALKKIPVRQDTAITGSLSVRGEVLPVGGVSSKIEAAIEAGIKRAIIPQANLRDVVIDKIQAKKIKIIPVATIEQALKEALDWKGNEKILKQIIK